MRKIYVFIFLVFISFGIISVNASEDVNKTTNVSEENNNFTKAAASNCWDAGGNVHIIGSSGPGAGAIVNVKASIWTRYAEKIESLVITLKYTGVLDNAHNINIQVLSENTVIPLDSTFFEVDRSVAKSAAIVFNMNKLKKVFMDNNIHDHVQFDINYDLDRVSFGSGQANANILINNDACPVFDTLVSASKPKLSKVKCDQTPKVILPKIKGVSYTVKKNKNSYIVKARALEGYALTNGKSQWTLNYKVKPCPTKTKGKKKTPILLQIPKTGDDKLLISVAMLGIGLLGFKGYLINRKSN